MTSQRVERTWIRTGGYGRFRGEWVKHQMFYKYCVLRYVHKLSNPLIIKKVYNNYCYMLFGVFKADCSIILTVYGHRGLNFVVGEKCSHIHLLAC